MISVETALQVAPACILRQQHLVPAGFTIRALLCQGGLSGVITRIESGSLGLSCHGRRAWLDDAVADGGRVEMVEPIHVDAKAARRERVAADRANRRTRFGSKG